MAITKDFPTYHTRIFILIDWIFLFLIEFCQNRHYFVGKQNHPDSGFQPDLTSKTLVPISTGRVDTFYAMADDGLIQILIELHLGLFFS